MYVTQFDYLKVLYERQAYRKCSPFLGKINQKEVHVLGPWEENLDF
jgi:hypothetical protein